MLSMILATVSSTRIPEDLIVLKALYVVQTQYCINIDIFCSATVLPDVSLSSEMVAQTSSLIGVAIAVCAVSCHIYQ